MPSVRPVLPDQPDLLGRLARQDRREPPAHRAQLALPAFRALWACPDLRGQLERLVSPGLLVLLVRPVLPGNLAPLAQVVPWGRLDLPAPLAPPVSWDCPGFRGQLALQGPPQRFPAQQGRPVFPALLVLPVLLALLALLAQLVQLALLERLDLPVFRRGF